MLTQKAGIRYLHDFNLQLRYGTQWDPTNAIAVINHIRSKGLGDNLDFELGNGRDEFRLHIFLNTHSLCKRKRAIYELLLQVELETKINFVHFLCILTEPGTYHAKEGRLTLSGTQIGKDYLMFKKVIDDYPMFKNSVLIGPESVSGILNKQGAKLVHE